MGIAEDDVLLACLVIVARHHGLAATPESLRAGLPIAEGGINASLLQRAARRVGLHSRLKKLSLKGFFNMDFNGVALNIELTHSHEGICDALYN